MNSFCIMNVMVIVDVIVIANLLTMFATIFHNFLLYHMLYCYMLRLWPL